MNSPQLTNLLFATEVKESSLLQKVIIIVLAIAIIYYLIIQKFIYIIQCCKSKDLNDDQKMKYIAILIFLGPIGDGLYLAKLDEIKKENEELSTIKHRTKNCN